MKPGLLMLPSAVSDSRVHNILPNKIETDFQFSRASSATRVNHQGLIENVQGDRPRLDYDPTNLTCPHLLLEPRS